MRLPRRTLFRQLFGAAGAAAFSFLILPPTFGQGARAAVSSLADIDRWRALSESDWAARLTADQYHILREEGTEAAYSSSLNDEKRSGTFYCAGCELSLFSSETKYDSGTGWPSFWAPIDQTHVATSLDFRLILPRTEIHCARCLGHLGHVFEDGPVPTGLRYCINGLALIFRPRT